MLGNTQNVNSASRFKEPETLETGMGEEMGLPSIRIPKG
jgi:hypothetical protein